jgi:hypothetical protein
MHAAENTPHDQTSALDARDVRESNALIVAEPVSSPIPGVELPRAVYVSVAAAFGLMFVFAWAFFGAGRETDFNLSVAGALMIVFLALPLIIYTTARHHLSLKSLSLNKFLASDVDTATGVMPGAQAWIEILLIPAALAIAAGLIGAVYAIVG